MININDSTKLEIVFRGTKVSNIFNLRHVRMSNKYLFDGYILIEHED